MTRIDKSPILKVPDDTAAAVWRGHPWVFGPLSGPEPGTVVQLRDHRSRTVGWGLADQGDIAVRVLGIDDSPTRSFEDIVTERIQRADAFRFRVVDGDTNTWRVLNGAGDGLPGLVLDRYDDVAVLKIYSAAWEPHLDVVVKAIRKLGWATGLLRRFGVRQVDGKTGSQVLFGTVADRVVVREHSMKLLVRPYDGQKTGLFLDQREHRDLVRRWSAGRRVANLFAYNGGFSVSAALGGASQVITVDIAPAAVEDAKENFRLNDLDPDHHVFEAADVFAWKPKGRLGLLVVDPPSLARGTRSRGAAASAYKKLHKALGGCIERDGLLGSSSCTAQLTYDAWLSAVSDGIRPHGSWSVLHNSRAATDHPVALGHAEGNYLKFALFRRLDGRGAS